MSCAYDGPESIPRDLANNPSRGQENRRVGVVVAAVRREGDEDGRGGGVVTVKICKKSGNSCSWQEN